MANSLNIPTARSYLWFVVKWHLLAFLTVMLWLPFFAAGLGGIGWLILAVFIVLLIRSSRKLSARAQRGLKRPAERAKDILAGFKQSASG